MFFLRKSTLERLPLVMTGARMGERALQIGVDDSSLTGAIAAKVGLSGHAAVVVSDERQAARAEAAAAQAGALIEVHVAALDLLPFLPDAFDLVVVHAGGLPIGLDDLSGIAVLRDTHRVLRPGGRIVIMEGGVRDLLRRLHTRRVPSIDTRLTSLRSAGFNAARLLAEREGHRFFEAVK